MDDEEEAAEEEVVEEETLVWQDGQHRVEVTIEAWSSRHCQWKWQPQGRTRSSGTVSPGFEAEAEPSSPESSGSRVRVRGSWQDLQVSAILADIKVCCELCVVCCFLCLVLFDMSVDGCLIFAFSM